MNLFDASALLCFLQGEPGADVVERELLIGGACTAANWSEVCQKLLSREQDWSLARGLLLSYGLRIEPVLGADAEQAAQLWRRGSDCPWPTGCVWRRDNDCKLQPGLRTPRGARRTMFASSAE